jgi:predicted enzyme related to lactoylglutathione lyase
MTGQLSHFAINADDVARARAFYEQVFGWTFEAWGPPGFLQINTGGDGPSAVRGALQQRRELKPGTPTIGFECSIAVDDVDRIAAEVTKNGGRVIMEKTAIMGVGYLIFLEDPEGNVVGAMHYDQAAS